VRIKKDVTLVGLLLTIPGRASKALARLVCGLLVCLVSLCTSVADAASPDMKELEIDHALTFDFPTPHTKWAKPYAGGKIRVLFFSDGTGTNPRECVELMQRFDIDAQAIFWAQITDSKESNWHGGELGERRMLNLLQQKWDTFVFLGLPMSNIPPAQKDLIVDAVTQGTGVVFVGVDDKTLLQSGKQIQPLPNFVANTNSSEVYIIGQGRGASLQAPKKIDYHEGWEIDYDHLQESLGRAVLWSAKKEPSTHLDLIASSHTQSSSRNERLQVGKPLTLLAKLTGKPVGENLQLHVLIRKSGFEDITLPEKNIAAGEEIKLLLPELSNGIWHADARVIGSSGIETWASLPFEMHSERSVSELILKQNWSEPGGVISGKVMVTGKRQPKETLRLLLLDRHRRELARKDYSISGPSTEFSFDMPGWLPMLVTVEARLISDNSEIFRAYKYFHVTKRKHGQFNFLIWGVPKGTIAPYAEESLAKHGVTLQLDWENPPLYVGAHDISWVPYTTHIAVEKMSNGTMKPFCWNDLSAVKKQTSLLSTIHQATREHGAFVYSLGDENKTLGSCISPYCANAYRNFLQESYGNLAALNHSWSTNFKDWKDVDLAMPSDDGELLSKASKNYPRWFDRQAYKSWNYVHYCLKYSKAYKEMDPRAKTGFDGAGGFASGDDLDLIVRNLDSWVPYDNIAEEVVRSIAPRDFIRSNWLGGRFKTADPLLQRYWRLVTLGADSIWWWMWSCIGDLHGFLAPDLRPFPEIVEVLKDTQIVRDGLGDLLLHSTMQDDGIAILYSYPSVFAHKIEEGLFFGGYEDAHLKLIKFIRAAGFQFHYITDRMLRQDEVDLSKFRILFLPRTEAIGDKEAQAIRRFVENGGTGIADFRVGLYDDHCKPREKGVLDDLFGVKQSINSKAKIINMGTGRPSQETRVDGGIILDGAQADHLIEGTPLWLTRSIGKGKTILFNSQMSAFSELVSTRVNKGNLWGFDPLVKITRPNGTNPEDLEVTRWKNEGIEIVSMLRKGGVKETVTISFEKTKFVYDLRARKTFGPCTQFITDVIPDRASFFIFTNKPVSDPQITFESPMVQQGMTAKLDIIVPGAEGLHAMKLSVQVGDQNLDWHNKTLLVGAKPITIDIPVAYNDPVGEYWIICTDLFTNKNITAKLTVQSNVTEESRKAN